MTNESITIVWKGQPFTVKKGAPNFVNLRKAIEEKKWDEVESHLTVDKSVEAWSNNKFKIEGDTVYYMGEKLPQGINRRIIAMASAGDDPTILYKFWERLSKNPSFRSVNQLWDFLIHSHIPFSPDGCFYAYKGVRNDFKDAHSGKVDNSPGVINEMPRNKISDDPDVACHFGFHVGAVNYARSFSQRMVICKVDPEHVVCVPKDSNWEKMRVCKYEVVGNYGMDLPSVVFDERTNAMTKSHWEDVPEEPDIEEEDGDELDDEVVDMAPGDGEHEESEDSYSNYNDKEDEDEKVAVVKKPKKAKKNKKAKSKSRVKNTDGSTTTKKVAKEFEGAAKFNKMDMKKLMEESLDDLRQYATYGLHIVGASKIPGGKTALVMQILKTRKK